MCLLSTASSFDVWWYSKEALLRDQNQQMMALQRIEVVARNGIILHDDFQVRAHLWENIAKQNTVDASSDGVPLPRVQYVLERWDVYLAA
jgi:hypothetical protein